MIITIIAVSFLLCIIGMFWFGFSTIKDFKGMQESMRNRNIWFK